MRELRFRLGLDLDMNEQPLFLAIESADLDQFVHRPVALFVFRAELL
jgi:hypothetical protein